MNGCAVETQRTRRGARGTGYLQILNSIRWLLYVVMNRPPQGLDILDQNTECISTSCLCQSPLLFGEVLVQSLQTHLAAMVPWSQWTTGLGLQVARNIARKDNNKRNEFYVHGAGSSMQPTTKLAFACASYTIIYMLQVLLLVQVQAQWAPTCSAALPRCRRSYNMLYSH